MGEIAHSDELAELRRLVRLIREDPSWALARVKTAAEKEQEVTRLAEQLQGAVEALRRYGKHRLACAWVRAQGGAPCDCGFAEALDRLGDQ